MNITYGVLSYASNSEIESIAQYHYFHHEKKAYNYGMLPS